MDLTKTITPAELYRQYLREVFAGTKLPEHTIDQMDIEELRRCVFEIEMRKMPKQTVDVSSILKKPIDIAAKKS